MLAMATALFMSFTDVSLKPSFSISGSISTLSPEKLLSGFQLSKIVLVAGSTEEGSAT